MDFARIQSVAAALAALSSAALAAWAWRQSPRDRFQRSFGVGMLAFAVESVAAFMLVQQYGRPSDVASWVHRYSLLSMSVPLVWSGFIVYLGETRPGGSSRRRRFTVGAVIAIVAAGALASVLFQTLSVFGAGRFFWGMRFNTLGRAGLVVQLLGTVVVLAGLEAGLRASSGIDRWRMKYVVLGLAGIFLVRFYFVSEALLFNLLPFLYVTTAAATLALGNLVIAAGMARGLRPIAFMPSQQILFRSTIVGLLGAYLFAVGVLGWIVRHFEISHGLFWGSLIVFASAVAVAAVALSDLLQWRVKRFIALHFYRSKYDYREQWRSFTARLGSLASPEARAPQLLQAVAGAVGATQGVMYLQHAVDNRYRCVADIGEPARPEILPAGAPVLAALQRSRGPLLLERSGRPADAAESDGFVTPFVLGVPLVWADALMGVILLGPERTGAPYGPEDIQFLATMGEQAAGALATAQLSEAAARAREFEAFHLLTSFVIHDIKNSVASLSLLSRNALDNFDDPEFQRDAIRTISISVARMKRLLARLSAPSTSAELAFDEVDLDVVAREAVAVVPHPTTVHVAVEAKTAVVRGDMDALVRVVENLVKNAVEAINGDGVVVVRAYREHEVCVLSVTDTGQGIPDEFLRGSLFVPFRSTKPGGWGVGLYQVKELVEKHGGTIAVTSRVGAGTTFTIRMAAAQRTDTVSGRTAMSMGGR